MISQHEQPRRHIPPNDPAHIAWAKHVAAQQNPCQCDEQPPHNEIDHGPPGGLDHWYAETGQHQYPTDD